MRKAPTSPSTASDTDSSSGGASPPPTPAHHVRRLRLLSLLDEAVSAPITAVVAPAGSGKTALLADWCASSSLPVAWVCLDESNQAGAPFWTAVNDACVQLVGGAGRTHAVPLPRSAASSELAAPLLTYDGDHPDTAVLVLDDIHLVDSDPDIVAALRSFLQSLPRWLHVVLLTRRTPLLPVDRLRARRQLREIHFAELLFTDKEAGDLLAGLVPSLDAEQIRGAVRRADGWAAGLQLAALALRSDEVRQEAPPDHSTSESLIRDYVWREVLADERSALIEALLDICIVGSVNADLAAALTGRPDADELLLEAEARGLLITRTEISGWLELHRVLQVQLMAEAQRRSPERIRAQHATAARWFEDYGAVTSALDHWLHAEQPRDALRLLALHVGGLSDIGQEAAIRLTLSKVPLNLATADLQSTIEYAWCHLLVDRQRFLEVVAEASGMAERVRDPGPTELGGVRMLQAVAATVTGDWEAASRLATTSMVVLGRSAWSDPLGRFGWNLVARAIALSENWNDESADVEAARVGLRHDADRRVAYEGSRALGQALAGRPVDALRVTAGVRDIAAVRSTTILRTELDLAEAIAHRELGERSKAVTELTSLAESVNDAMVHTRVLAMFELTQLRLDQGDLVRAEHEFHQAHELVRSDFSGPGGLSWLARTGTQVALATGNVESARSWARQVDDPFWGGVSLARVSLVEGRRGDAVELLDRVTPRCVRHEVVSDLIRLQATEAREEALALVVRVVERATSVGLLQTVASDGADLLELLEVNAFLAPKAWLERLRRAAVGQPGAVPSNSGLPGEQLTKDELEVLRKLPGRLTLKEIAAELLMSPDTLKFRLKVIYGKLGVGSRPEAASLARRMTGPSQSRHGHA